MDAKWDRERVIAAMQRWYREEGRAPTSTDWRLKARDWTPSHTIVTNLFGSWDAARDAAGLDKSPRRHEPRQRGRREIAAELRALADELDPPGSVPVEPYATRPGPKPRHLLTPEQTARLMTEVAGRD